MRVLSRWKMAVIACIIPDSRRSNILGVGFCELNKKYEVEDLHLTSPGFGLS